MQNENGRIPALNKSDPPLPTMLARARALELACRAAAQILASRSRVAAAELQEPLPESTVRLLRRLPRSHG